MTPQLTPLLIALLAGLLAACVAATLFPIIYTIRAPWWRKPIGRALMISNVALAAALDLTAVNIFLKYDAALLVEAIVFWFIALGAMNHLRFAVPAPTEGEELR